MPKLRLRIRAAHRPTSGGGGVAPSNNTLPTISGTAQVGQTSTVSTGSWSGDPPITYTYQWRRATTSGGTYSDISGATNSTYVPVTGDENYYLRAVVTGTNSYGSANATSAASSQIAAVAGSSQLTTLTLANTSGSSVPSGFITPMFGHAFKKGDVASGDYPKFETTGGTDIPYTMWNTVTWNDGSLKFAGFMLKVPSSVSGSGSLTINVKNGGSSQSASARSTSDLSAQDLKVEFAGTSGLSGTWTTSLNQGITDNDDVVVVGDGQAGKIWRIRQQFMQSGSNHGQLECWWYVAALQDSSGNLAGIRYLARAALPWVDVDSPTKTHGYTMTATLKNGGSTVRSLNGGSSFRMPHFCSVFSCDSNGLYDYVAGSISTDATIQVKPDRTYQRSTRVVPPYDFTVSPTADSSYSYAPMSRGPIEAFIDGTGYHTGVGILPEWGSRYFIGQSLNSERACRVAALSHGAMNICLRRTGTKQIPVLNNSSYSNMGTAAPTMRWRGNSADGFTAPSGTFLGSTWDSNQGSWNTSHWPSLSMPAYIISAEPQYLDMLQEDGNNAIITRNPSFERNYTVSSVNYYGVCQNDPSQARTDAWGLREIYYAAGLTPDAHVAKSYFNDLAATQFTYNKAFNLTKDSNWQTNGLYHARADDGVGQPWQIGFLLLAASVGWCLTEHSDAKVMLDYLVKFWKWHQTSASTWMLTGYNSTMRQTTSGGSAIITSMDQYYMIGGVSGSGGIFTHDFGTSGAGAVALQANDEAIFWGSAPSGFTSYTKYYVRDVNNGSRQFRLAATPGGTAISVPSGSWAWALRFHGPQTSWGMEFNNEGGYTAGQRAAICYAEAAGGSNAGDVRPDFDTMMAAASFNFTSNPKNALSATF